MLGKIFDGAGIFLAAVLTLCAFALLFLPWKKALNIPDPPPQSAATSVVYVSVGATAKTPQNAAAPVVQKPK